MKKTIVYLLITMLILTAVPYASAEDNGIEDGKGDGTFKATDQMNRQEILSSVSVLAGSGDFDDWDGAALTASFRMPQGLAVGSDGSVLVADSNNHLIRQIRNGQVTTYAGFMLDADAHGIPSGGWNDGTKQTSAFNSPAGMDTDSEGNVYIADSENHVIRIISKGGMVSTLAGDGVLGHKDGAAAEARFDRPQDVAVAADGTVYVADALNHMIRRITPDGQVTTLNAPSDRVIEVTAGYAVPAGDYADGELSKSKFNEPTSLAIDGKGNLYVSDTGNHLIRYIDLAEGTVTTVAGLSQGELPVYEKGALYARGGYADGSSSEARFYSPRGIAVTEEQGLIITDSLNHAIRYFVNGQVSTIAGVPAQFGQVEGINGHNLLHLPTDVAVLPSGNLLIADSYNNQIRELEWYKLPGNLPENDQVKVVFGDQIIQFDAQPEIVQGRTMVPVRALSEKMGYEVGFEDSERKIELTKGDATARLQVGSLVIATENKTAGTQEQREMEAAPYIKAGRTYVPLRFFSEAFGADVAWDRNTRTVILREIAEAVEWAPPADRKTRAATLEQINGTVWISQAGGSLSYRAYDGMSLHHGDRIITEFQSSAILKTVDRKDELTVSENSELYISDLSSASQVKHTSFVLWSGMIGASVTPLIDSKDTFKIMTATAQTDVRGTNFIVGIDPVTGASRLFVSSGLVQGSGSGTDQGPVPVYPAQQLGVIPGSGSTEPNVPYILDPADFVNQASPAVIEQLLKQKQKLDQENREMLERMKNGAAGSGPGDNPYHLSPYDLEQFGENMNNLLANIARQALDQQKLDRDRLQEIIDEANKDSDNKIDLNHVPPLQLTEQQRQQQERQKRLEDERNRQQEEQSKQREQQALRDSLMNKILAEKERLEQENKKQQEAALKRAEDLLKQQLSDAEKQRFEQQQQALERQKQQQEAAQRPQAPAPSGPPTPAQPRAAMPAASIESGSVKPGTEIELTTATEGAAIYYTTDGSAPSASNGTLYGEPLVIERDTTIRAVAVKTGYTNSPVLTVSFTVIIPEEEPEAAMPAASVESGSVEPGTVIELTTATEGAAIYYTTDGSAPTASNGTLYEEPLVIERDTTIKAVAVMTGYTNSPVLTVSFTVIIPEEEPEATMPAASVESGSVEPGTEIELTTATEGAAIYYTTDGSAPSASNGTLYEGPFVIERDTTIKAVAVKTSYTNSPVLTVSYTVIIPEKERPEFAEGYPKTYAETLDELTLINVLVQTDQSGMVFFIVVPHDAAAPSTEQMLAGFVSPDPGWLAYYYADIAADREFHYAVELKDQVTEYDVYVVSVVGFDGAASKVRKATVVAPPEIDQPDEDGELQPTS
ncbi:FN3 associated domain-containing protein [Paenibacillus sp. 1011MAR3C5]|uniref:FN3 associated domain-containing protein n=1 Tax=Paenibacillus sp. 1011MAR3C5 TaxID=1675787 RepID=UPI001603495F|nr:FN3 associated domain-containing protein [Paenibacillus sp. 1011MAR3C5]